MPCLPGIGVLISEVKNFKHITIKVKQANKKRPHERHHNYKGKTNKQQKIP
jgi:hypothetical protein